MADDRSHPHFTPVNPYALARNEALAAQLKRFYREASIAEGEGGFRVLLDGRASRTPGRRTVVLPSVAAAQLVADEWNGQGEILKPGDMPLMRLVNTVIDGVASAASDVRAEIVRFAGSDLLFYRAESPPVLVDLQAAAWDPVLAWSRDQLQARFSVTHGIVHVVQPDHALAAVDRAIGRAIGDRGDAIFRLGALHLMTTLTGSALLAIAVLYSHVEPGDAWRKAHVDEDFQMARWGEDEDAAIRRARRWADMRAAAHLLMSV